MASLITQFNDLTEVSVAAFGASKGKRWDGEYYYPELNGGKPDIKTEFAFGTARTVLPDNMKAYGFEHKRTMINWWPTHLYEKVPLFFFWWKNPKPSRPQTLKATRQSWGEKYYNDYKYMGKYDTQATGCGFKLGELPLVSYKWYHYFTLLRLPKLDYIHNIQKAWLKQRHFKLLDEGSVSTFWINGWAPTTYSVDKEIAFWQEHDKDHKYYNALHLQPSGKLYYEVSGANPQH